MPPPRKIPKVQLTELLRNILVSDGYDTDEFARYFARWKALGPAGEFSDPYFGKDGEYAKPMRGGRRVLRHVHLPPERDPDQLTDWERKAARRSRKTSDTALIYAYDPQHGFLLIFFAREPHGHTLAAMHTTAAAQLMEQLADAAEQFIHYGSIII